MKDREIERHKEEYEVLKRELERRIQEVQGELALQKQVLLPPPAPPTGGHDACISPIKNLA